MKLPDREDFQRIYDALQDNVSREIYKHRLLYSLLGDETEISALADDCLPAGARVEVGKFCYYGAGMGGLGAIETNRNVPFVVDKYKTGSLLGVPIISLEKFLTLPNCKDFLVIITVGKPKLRDEILRELSGYGLRCIRGYLGDQYFDLPELNLRNEYFVDAGAEDGETSRYFLDHFENGHVYTLEPSPDDFEVTKECLRDYPQAEVFPCGAYDRNGLMSFDASDAARGSARISPTGVLQVEVRRLDDLLEGRKVTFIKMDIEGPELAALRGAEQIIRKQRPKLAICVYHKPEDMWEIPEFILRCHPDYRLYLRHYSLCRLETVLYAL